MQTDLRTFTFGERLGLVFIVQSASLSVVAVVGLLAYLALKAVQNVIHPPAIGSPRWRFLRNNADFYFLSLLASDLLLAIGSMMDIKWVHDAHLARGSFCTSQGVIKQVGNVGVALASLAIAIHTFLVLFFRWRAPQGPLIPIAVVTTIWIFLILVTTISSQTHKDPPYYGPSTYWCWIDKSYTGEQIGLEYGILWFTAAVSITLYALLFFCLRGNIVVSRKPSLKIAFKSVDTQHAWARNRNDPRYEAALQMLAYPIAYIILILPISVVRWISFTATAHVPSEWTAFAGVFFSASGFVNVLLYVRTRPALFPSFGRSHEQREVRADEEGVITQGMRTGAVLQEGTMMSVAPTSNAPRTNATAPVPMLSDDDDDDDIFTPTDAGNSPNRARGGSGLTVPPIPDKSSWTSDASKHSVGRTSDFEHGVNTASERKLSYGNGR